VVDSHSQVPRTGLRVVLVEPEIPPNTGSIARLCAATATPLHLIRPLGFSLDDRYLKRAGLDYWPFVDVTVHDDWPAFAATAGATPAVFFSARAAASFLHAPLAAAEDLFLVFGGETRGLPRALLEANPDRIFRIPQLTEHVRSLNLANAVSIVLYEALRQRGALG
jgi:tRNA (cytidine/uridine-2'-O-)-methyltransferase